MSSTDGVFARVLDFLTGRLQRREQRHAALGKLIDFLLEVRHREACILRVEEQLGDTLSDVPVNGRVLIRLTLNCYLERILPPLHFHEFEALRLEIAAEDPLLAFRLRTVGVTVGTLLAPATEIVRLLPEHPAGFHFLDYVHGEVSAAFLGAIDNSLQELAVAHSSRTRRQLDDYYERFSETPPELERLTEGIASVLRGTVGSVRWSDLPEALGALRQTLGLPPVGQ